MRWILAVVLVASACGPDRYGTYFIADGEAAGIEFDHAEFYFGDHIGNAFGSPAAPAPQKGEVYQRLFNAADASVPTAHGSQIATYYLAPDGDTNVGDYVLVIARDAQNAIVGVGASEFALAGDHEVFEIRAVLEAPGSNVQEWGAGTARSCVAWTRNGMTSVAFVRGNDRDCDGALSDADCNDFLYCAAGDPKCSTAVTLCSQPCAFGCNTAAGCVPSVCVFANVCDLAETCAMKPTPADVLKCFATTAAVSHLDVRVPTAPQNNHQNVPCVYQFTVPLTNGARCSNPSIVYAEPFADGYQFEVEDNGSSCKFQLNMQSQPFVGDHHLLVAIDSPSGGVPRSTFFLGFNPLSGATCTSVVSTENPLTITSCQ